jgi:hypothetical protein
LNGGGKICFGIAAETNGGLATSALMTASPNCRAILLFGGNCSFFLTIADCGREAIEGKF